MAELNKFNFDLANRIQKYQQEMLKAERGPQRVRDKQREEKIGGRRTKDFVRPSGNVPRVDEDIFTVNVTRAELEGGKINRLKKAQRWTGFSTDTASKGIGLADEAYGVYKKHDAKSQVMNRGLDAFDNLTGSGTNNGKISRIKKAEKWRDYSVNTASDGIGLVDQAWTVKDKHDPKSQILNRGLGMTGSGLSKKKLETAVNRLQSYMDGASTKPTKLQMSVLKQAGIIDEAKKTVKKVTGGSTPRQPSPWVVHVQKYATANNIPYNQALTEAKPSYKK